MSAQTLMSDGVATLLGDPGSFAAGSWLRGGERAIEAINPSTEDVMATLPRASVAEVDQAVRAAREAFDRGPWPRMAPRERALLMNRLVERLDAHRDELTEIGLREVGSPLLLSRVLHAGAPITFFEYWAEMAVKGPNGRWSEGLPIHDNPVLSASMLIKEPIGVVASIIAYNFPLLIISFKIGAALASGCTSVIMPSPRAATA